MTGDERREQILDVAHAIVDAEGFHAATPRRVAEAAGVTRTVLYQQFGDMAGLFVTLIDRESALAVHQYLDAFAGLSDGVRDDPFLSAFEAAVRAVDGHPATWRLFLLPAEGAPPLLYERLAERQEAVQKVMEANLVEEYPGLADPEYIARAVHASGRELLRLRLTDPEGATVERLIDAVRTLRTFVPVSRAGDGGA